VAAWIHTPTWQLATLPSAPQYCGATPTEWRPYLGKAVSSSTPRSRLDRRGHAPASRRRTGTGSQGGLVDELLQRLFQVAHALALAIGVRRGQAGRLRLDRLALAVQQQPAQVGLSSDALVGAWHRRE
jgi:hypothetical protein